MFNIVRKSIEWGHDTLTLETGRIARQADAAVVATYGETSVLGHRRLREEGRSPARTSSR